MGLPGAPDIIGIGRFVERLDQPENKALSATISTASAAAAGLAATRIFAGASLDPNRFESSNNFPGPVALRPRSGSAGGGVRRI